MTKVFGRWVLGLAVIAAGVGVTAPAWLRADGPVATQVATVDELKAQAFKALRAGQFDKTNELLSRAASAGPADASLAKMAEWTKAFEAQRQTFVAERRKQFDKAVEDVKKLQKAGKADYALDYVAKAYLLADDKKAFRNEGWVDELIKGTVASAKKYEAAEQWLKALRLYSDLGSVEPANPEWKEKLKTSTRRIRLLAMYNQEQFKKIQEAEATEREAVDQLIKPATQPTSKPTVKPEDDKDDSFKTDWRQSLKDIRMDMLWNALVDARTNYYREVSYRDLGLGGLKSLRLLATTKGLEAAFPNLKDEAKRAAFLAKVDDWQDRMKNATAANEQLMLRRAIDAVARTNDDSVQLPEEVLVNEFADGAFAELDPFTSMIWPNDVEEFNKTTQGEFSGVGIQIQSDDDGSLRVVSPLEDSPGYKAGIKAGDIITKINGKNAKGISLNQAVKNITGKPFTKVNLTIRSADGATRDLDIVRQTIKVASIKGWSHRPGGGWEYFIDPANKIGYIRLTNFTKMTSDELDKAASEMRTQGVRGLILDLRYNPGGLLTAATEVSDKFLNNGVIVSTRADRETPNQPTEARASAQADEEKDLPLVVLVNQYSASASEIVSGALKDQKRAMIVGERTFGKGSVQMLFPLAQRTAYLKLTTSHYYLPNGKCIHREENSIDWGVNPDVTVEMTPEQMRAAIDSRQELDVLREKEAAGEARPVGKDGKPIVKKDPLSQDPQLSAALLLLRLQLAGAQI
ncbi:MAG TPA: S41 family peptidase [Tepidisphaeraceae bacterium]|nr:S41 family peptidase [Tepidisphaeraceae bacterium]